MKGDSASLPQSHKCLIPPFTQISFITICLLNANKQTINYTFLE